MAKKPESKEISPEQAQAVLVEQQRAKCEEARVDFIALKLKYQPHGIHFEPTFTLMGNNIQTDIAIVVKR